MNGHVAAKEAAYRWCAAHHTTTTCSHITTTPPNNADTQQKGFFGRSLRKLESLLDKSASGPAAGLALEPDLASRLSSEQQQLLHLNRALLYYLSGERLWWLQWHTYGCLLFVGCCV